MKWDYEEPEVEEEKRRRRRRRSRRERRRGQKKRAPKLTIFASNAAFGIHMDTILRHFSKT